MSSPEPAGPAPGPTVSILLPTLNEQGHLRDCLDSLRAQDWPGIVEVLVLDGGSNDDTSAIAKGYGPPVSLVPNPGVTAASAMNLGISLAAGEVVVRADAHTLYAADYVRRCVEVLEETGAANVGGRMDPVGATTFGRAVAAVTSSPFGMGPGAFHYATEQREVDTVYLGCWHRSTLVELGGYDETSLQWGAEDHELNHRIRRAGGRIVLDPSIRSWYFPRQDLRSLWRQYRNYGLGKASTLAKHRELPTWRPLAPAGLVAAAAAGALLLRGPVRLLVPAGHAAACGVVALRLGRAPGVAPHRAFLALEACHWSYGLGFWSGVRRILTGRPFDSRPAGGRR
jgi:glycosyltransferase involved in cell wall biosynthesis